MDILISLLIILTSAYAFQAQPISTITDEATTTPNISDFSDTELDTAIYIVDSNCEYTDLLIHDRCESILSSIYVAAM